MFKEIVTERLRLRKIKLSDAKSMFLYAANKETTRYMGWQTHNSIEETNEYLKSIMPLYKTKKYYDWAIELKENGKMIGTCGFVNVQTNKEFAEIGYIIHQDYHKKGYGTEAVQSLIEFGFKTLRLTKIYARIYKENKISIRLAKKCGFTLEVQPEHPLTKDHICSGALSYSIKNAE
ncbi:MAG: GNAT family N-acetyltransferase [Spirochaetia bacterium]|nr:GNAT family N-acetyltransferase [Spirochaetia bacterium]